MNTKIRGKAVLLVVIVELRSSVYKKEFLKRWRGYCVAPGSSVQSFVEMSRFYGNLIESELKMKLKDCS